MPQAVDDGVIFQRFRFTRFVFAGVKTLKIKIFPFGFDNDRVVKGQLVRRQIMNVSLKGGNPGQSG